ncbi:jg23860 [Pararge aegeria aegeria]|uniref:Jg23860 protein n=1 Tax=Pararge aegeria aegeria TaxID=348720 RepID=A0A8S4RR25_9NEOP|nr:jg23860 [Pararge aegeria aegeria]
MTYGSETRLLTLGLIRRLRITKRAMEMAIGLRYVIKSEIWRSVELKLHSLASRGATTAYSSGTRDVGVLSCCNGDPAPLETSGPGLWILNLLLDYEN